jgi:hypothetical protein
VVGLAIGAALVLLVWDAIGDGSGTLGMREAVTIQCRSCVLSVLLLAVVIFALQNTQAVTVRFLFCRLQSSAGRRGASHYGSRRADDCGTVRIGAPSAALEAQGARD